MIMQKKKHPRFNVPNQGTYGRGRIKDSWRKQRGIDNKKRIKMRKMGASPEIGYRNPEQLRGLRCDNTRAMLVHNMRELQALIESGRTKEFVAVIAKQVATRKRIEMTRLASQHSLRVTNGVYK
jgi:large subunit ribosomal protein L32e